MNKGLGHPTFPFVFTCVTKVRKEITHRALSSAYCYFMPLLFIAMIEFKTSTKSRNCLFIIDSTYLFTDIAFIILENFLQKKLFAIN